MEAGVARVVDRRVFREMERPTFRVVGNAKEYAPFCMSGEFPVAMLFLDEDLCHTPKGMGHGDVGFFCEERFVWSHVMELRCW